MANPKKPESTYSIGAVARLTGLTTHTIRMWEHRYQAVSPARTDTGRRAYTASDVEKLSMLKALTDQGSPISSVADLTRIELEARLEQDRAISHSSGPVTVAAMGHSIPTLLHAAAANTDSIRLLASSAEPQELKADLAGRSVDVLLLEFAVLSRHAIDLVHQLYDQCGGPRCFVVYRFGRSADESLLTAEGFITLRSPVSGPELIAAITSNAADQAAGQKQQNPDSASRSRRSNLSPAPPRRYSPGQLNRLSNIDSSVDCECPHHLAEILSALAAFETYSRNCEETDDKQATLHAYLHNATGHARGVMEEALSHLLEIEKISI
ncbi:MAG: MerR family transcriptional regulator [Xanthomonadales bacterium]|nr:MerR family transcriptional regulator [Xanthomonadales bacterium]